MDNTLPSPMTPLPVISELHTNPALPGWYTARIQDVDCELELRLDLTGHLIGQFSAEGESLEIRGGVPSVSGETFGRILAPDGDILAVFRAVPNPTGLSLELDAPNPHDLMRLSNAERVIFTRQKLAQPRLLL